MLTKKTIQPRVRDYLGFYETDLGAQVLKREAEYVKGFLLGCDKILDVGCGPGVFEKELSDLNIVGLDKDANMIAAARSIARNEFHAGNAENLPFAGESFDGVFSVASFCFMENPTKAVDEWVRVLKPHGRMVSLFCNTASHYFRGMLVRGGYSARNLMHEDFMPFVDYMKEKFKTRGEYFLGIKDGLVFDSDDPETASIYAVKGTLK